MLILLLLHEYVAVDLKCFTIYSDILQVYKSKKKITYPIYAIYTQRYSFN